MSATQSNGSIWVVEYRTTVPWADWHIDNWYESRREAKGALSSRKYDKNVTETRIVEYVRKEPEK